MPRQEIASDSFDTAISAAEWANGEADWPDFAWITGGHIEPASGSGTARIRRKVGIYSADQYSEATIQGHNKGTGSLTWIGAVVRAQDSATDESHYHGIAISANSTGAAGYAVEEVDDTFGFTSLATAGTGHDLSPGDQILLEVVDDKLELSTDEGGAGYVSRIGANGSLQDPTIVDGWPGAAVFDPAASAQAQITAWSGGDVTTSQTVNLDQVSESGQVNAIQPGRTLSLGQVPEAGQVSAVQPGHAVQLGQVLEGGQVFGLQPGRSLGLAQVVEAGQVFGLQIAQGVALGQVVETGMVSPLQDAVPLATVAILDRAAVQLAISSRPDTALNLSDRPETRLQIGDRRCA